MKVFGSTLKVLLYSWSIFGARCENTTANSDTEYLMPGKSGCDAASATISMDSSTSRKRTLWSVGLIRTVTSERRSRNRITAGALWLAAGNPVVGSMGC